METYCLVVAESESLARTRQFRRTLKCSPYVKVCLQEVKTGNQLHRQELPPPKQSSNQTPAQLGEAKCRLASKQILHLDITARASSEMLLRWSLLMSINATSATERSARPIYRLRGTTRAVDSTPASGVTVAHMFQSRHTV